MNLFDLPGFLVGNRACIERLARSRVPLVIGPFLVLSASLARNYDGAALPQEWTMLTHGIVASVVNAFFLHCIMRLSAGRSFPGPPFWKSFAAFLGLFWLTAPMALVYAIPFERFLEPVEAIKNNLWTLAAISVWRVVLIARVISVLAGVRIWAPLFLTLLYSDVVVFIAAMLMNAPIVNFMGGMQHAPPEAILTVVRFFTAQFSMLAFLPLAIVTGVVANGFKPVWISVEPQSRSLRPSRPVLIFTCFLLAIWIAPLAWTQPEQHLRFQVDSLILNGRAADALQLLDEHERSELPPMWDPEPQLAYRGDHEAALAEIVDAFAVQPPSKKWVRELMLDKMLSRVIHGTTYHSDSLEGWADYLEERPDFRQDIFPPPVRRLIRLLLAQDDRLSDSDRAFLARILAALERKKVDDSGSPQ